MKLMWSIAIVVLVNFVSSKEDSTLAPTLEVYEPSWTYKCVPEEGCERSARPHTTSVNSSTPSYDSIDVCRTVCGRFGGIWPKPVSAALSMQTVKIHPNYLRFDLSNAPADTRDLLVQMTHVTTGNLLDECDGNVTDVVTTPVVVYITVRTTDMDLTWDTDEQYLLDVQSKDKSVAVHIVAETVYGARHGLETFTHLVASERPEYTENYHCSLRLVSGAKISDKPAFKHRGFMLDTSRNFIPLADIKRMIDGMATTKMNVFHWHATDSHSFPLESTRVPQFTRYGAYSPYDIYTTADIRDLIKYAQIRGVRVIIEIDSPAHAGNGWQWGKVKYKKALNSLSDSLPPWIDKYVPINLYVEFGYGDLAVCVNAKPWRNLCIQPPCGQLNPANPHMYRVLRDLYRDIAEALPRPALFHMGGDEVFFNCWNSTDEITSYMQGKGIETNLEGFIRLWAEFHATALKIWDEELTVLGQAEKQPVMLWSSELTQAHRIQKYLNKDRYVIEVWEPLTSPLLSQLTRLGYRTVSVPKDVWYLDHGFWGTTSYSNWRRMYSHVLPRDPLVLGGEVAMWSEYVDTNSLDARVWPRAAAVAERLWSDPTSSVSAAEARMQRVRARLTARRLFPDALAPAWCAHHDSRCL